VHAQVHVAQPLVHVEGGRTEEVDHAVHEADAFAGVARHVDAADGERVGQDLLEHHRNDGTQHVDHRLVLGADLPFVVEFPIQPLVLPEHHFRDLLVKPIHRQIPRVRLLLLVGCQLQSASQREW